MLMLLSPAKALNFEAGPPAPLTTPELKADIAELAKTTVKLRERDLQRLMGISDKLAALNRARFQAFDPAVEDGLQAVFAFNGDVYQGLQARSLDRKALAYAQDHLRILSGLYGVLRPLDAIQPYRLEMGIRLKTRRGENLYQFWKKKIAPSLLETLAGHRDRILVNLASQEYFGAVDLAALDVPVLTCHFKQEAGGEVRMNAFFAKKARGLMARHAIDNRLERIDDLKTFDREGYRYRESLSSNTDWVFVRTAD